tara:strand:- start:169 stop:1020 length:852 start_codon:yes stop_codon:yes gene_type:complete
MTEDRLGIWAGDKRSSRRTERYIKICKELKHYKEDDFVLMVPLFSHLHKWGAYNTEPETVDIIFKELRPFILENPIYIDVLYSEMDGYVSLDSYLTLTSKIRQVTKRFNDIDAIANIRTSWNNIRMLWYLKHIHENIKPIWEFDNIIDFGAGTGHFIKHCYQVGFSGSVQIVDLPEATHIQKYVLRGLDIKWVDAEKLLTKLPNTLFNSTWGISEIPISSRDKLPDLSSCSKFIAYQHVFFGVDNKKDILKRFYKKDNSILRDISFIAPWDEGSTFLISKSFI